MNWHPSASAPSFLRHSFVITCWNGTGLATCYPSVSPFGLPLGPALPWADQPSPGTLGLSVSMILAYFSLLMPTFSLLFSSHSLSTMLLPEYNAPLPLVSCDTALSFGVMFSPQYFRRDNPRPVSCYALFKGWLLLSQPPGCPGIITSLLHLT